jgi:hypothetical protein
MDHLKQNYDIIILGKNYLSLIAGIAHMKSGKSVLIVDDGRLSIGQEWLHEIGLIEKTYLEHLLDASNIYEIKKLDQYLADRETILFLDDNMVQLGASPYTNIRELARKLPQCFGQKFISKLDKINPEEIDKQCADFAQTIAINAFLDTDFESFQVGVMESALKGNLKKVYELFLDSLINSNTSQARQLHFSLQIIFQTMFSNVKKPLEIYYLFTSMLNPRFQVHKERLEQDLLEIFHNSGGDYKKTNITDWQFHKRRLRGVVLDSFEGYIQADHLDLFSDISWQLPFNSDRQETTYKTMRLSAPLEHDFINFYVGKRIVFTFEKNIGTDYPHVILFIDEKKKITAKFTYPDSEGAKASFHKSAAYERVFECLNRLLPGLDKNNWLATVSAESDVDVWSEFKKMQASSPFLSTRPIQNRELVYERESGSAIKGVDYWGPMRVKEMGPFAYLLDLKDDLFR